jgi:prepilin-type N-terminal cleavage/methylation domain-containing protein
MRTYSAGSRSNTPPLACARGSLNVNVARVAKQSRDRKGAEAVRARGVTLIEMIIVVALIGLIAAISFPAVSSGIDSLRMTSASTSIVAFLNSALNRAERRQEPIEVVVSVQENNLAMRSPDPSFTRSTNMPDGVKIDRILPPLPGVEDERVRSVILYPGSAPPRIGVEIVNRKGDRRIVRVDPTTGVPAVERVLAQ